MTEVKVTLEATQQAKVVIDIGDRDPSMISAQEYRQMALEKLDESGGAEWVTTDGDVYYSYAEWGGS